MVFILTVKFSSLLWIRDINHWKIRNCLILWIYLFVCCYYFWKCFHFVYSSFRQKIETREKYSFLNEYSALFLTDVGQHIHMYPGIFIISSLGIGFRSTTNKSTISTSIISVFKVPYAIISTKVIKLQETWNINMKWNQ